MNRKMIFPFILKTEHDSAMRQKDDEILNLRNTLRELNQPINNESFMTNEQINQLKNSFDSLANRIAAVEEAISNMKATIAEVKKVQSSLETSISNILKSPGATSAIATAVTDPVIADESPRSVLADIDLVHDFETALAKVEEAYGN